MKKKVLFIVMTLGAFIGVNAQPTLTVSDAPEIGDMFINAHDTVSVLSPNVNRGENVTWDYTNLHPSYVDTTITVAPSTVDNNDAFGDATFAQISSVDTSFYKTSSDKVELIGFLLKGNPARFSDPLTALVSPFTYGDNFTDASQMSTTFPFDTTVNGVEIDSVRMTMNTDVKDTAIGYGILKLPGIQYSNVLLNKRNATHHEVVDVHVVTFNLGWKNFIDTTYSDINYAFYVNGYGDILLGFTVDGNNVKGVTYRFDGTSSIKDVASNQGIKLYPNPVNNKMFIEAQVPVKQITIYNANGKVVKVINDNNKKVSIDVSGLFSGNYLMKIKTTNSQTIAKQFIKN